MEQEGRLLEEQKPEQNVKKDLRMRDTEHVQAENSRLSRGRGGSGGVGCERSPTLLPQNSVLENFTTGNQPFVMSQGVSMPFPG